MALKVSRRTDIAPFFVMEVMRAADEREAAGGDVLHLEVGQPATPAPKPARDAAIAAIETEVLGKRTGHLPTAFEYTPEIIQRGIHDALSLGRMLAEALSLDFIDADDEFEIEQQRRISEWIPEDEPGFREAEAELLTRLVGRQGAVVALGGGVVERPDSLALLAAQSRVLALELSQQEQIRRRQGDTRPALIKSNLPDEVRVLHKRRAELYLKASSGRRINIEGNLLTAFLRLLQSINLIG